MNEHWSHRYIGIPYLPGGRGWNGVDCWGLLRLFYQHEKGILLPDYPIAALQTRDVVRLIESHIQEWKRLEFPEDGCAVAMGMKDSLHHVGIWTDADGGRVIHCWKPAGVIAQPLEGLRLWGFRRVEFYGLHH